MRPLIAGNWKMNGLVAQLDVIERIAASATAAPLLADVLICPPATLIGRAVQTAAGRIAIGGQDCASLVAGAFTGDTSAEMLKDAGASAVIVGHSERRQHHGETDAIVATKVLAAWRAGLLAIICIGETMAQRRAGRALSEVHAHIRESLTTRWGAEARKVRILYGGSVNPSNARAILALPEVGGALVGGASLKAADFEAILGAVAAP
jgi:triosephosphate isomerase